MDLVRHRRHGLRHDDLRRVLLDVGVQSPVSVGGCGRLPGRAPREERLLMNVIDDNNNEEL